MENILSYSEFSSKIPESGQSFLLLYREGSEQSVCALRNIENAFSGGAK
ncbi:MAG: NrdH-redoxin, partial [Bacteroidales bacterium]|nr:NrdH-redoxin [Bacteroidales bacterium]